MKTPCVALPAPAEPSAATPMRLPARVSPSVSTASSPCPAAPSMTLFRSVTFADRVAPSAKISTPVLRPAKLPAGSYPK